MRFRLGLLQDTAAIEKQIAKDAAEARKPPTVKTEAQTKADEAKAKDPDKGKEHKKKPKIRPLSEAKAIDLGANFVSETFLLAVGIALILGENARRERQQANRREDITDKIEELQKMNKLERKILDELDIEHLALRTKSDASPRKHQSLLPQQLRQIEEEEEEDDEPTKRKGWFPWIRGLLQSRTSAVEQPEPAATNNADKVEEANATSAVPATSTTILGKILPQSHPKHSQSRSAEQPEPPIRTSKQSVERAPKEK